MMRPGPYCVSPSPSCRSRRESGNVKTFEEHLQAAAAMHGHLCAGQVIGVRMARRGCLELGLDPDERADRQRLIVYVEVDRCATDAISSVTGCKLGKRTLKHVDYGKVAATFVDTRTGRAVRVVAREDARDKARAYGDGDGSTPPRLNGSPTRKCRMTTCSSSSV